MSICKEIFYLHIILEHTISLRNIFFEYYKNTLYNHYIYYTFQPKAKNMKVLKKILIALLIIIAIPLIVALFVKKDYSVMREIVINKPQAEVFNYVKYLKNQNNYSKWANMDPNMIKTYTGTDGTVGFISAWDSKNDEVGKGEQEIKKITEGSRIDYELRFIKPFESTEQAYMITEAASPTQTKVKWGFEGHMAYPMNIMMLFMDFDKMIGSDLNTGLDKLKTVMETQP